MHFNRLRGVQPPLSLQLGTSPIMQVTDTRFLGMTLDSKLYRTSHIKNLRTRCLKGLQILTCLSHLHWGADRVTLLRVYRSLIRSALDYGCQLCRSATVSALKTLDPIHHRVLHIASEAFRSSPVVSLYAETGESSFQHRRDKLCLQMYVRILGMSNSPAYCATTSRDTDHLLASGTHFKPFGYRVRQLLMSLNSPQPAVLPSHEYISPPYAQRPPLRCPGIIHDYHKVRVTLPGTPCNVH